MNPNIVAEKSEDILLNELFKNLTNKQLEDIYQTFNSNGYDTLLGIVSTIAEIQKEIYWNINIIDKASMLQANFQKGFVQALFLIGDIKFQIDEELQDRARKKQLEIEEKQEKKDIDLQSI